jgi:Domain of unknown function (DUF5615)
VRLLLDEMYPPALAEDLHSVGVDATTVAELGLTGSSDSEVFAAAVVGGYAVLTENGADFAPIAAEHHTAGGHHHGLLIALSSRFSRRPAGRTPLLTAIQALRHEDLDDRTVYLEQPDSK